MTTLFEELDHQTTPLGDISLRRRSEPKLNDEVLYEVKLNDEFLMSSLFTEAEIQLSKLGLAALKQNGHKEKLDIVVGGLGLGYTAVAALEDTATGSLIVIDVMQAVINWHEKHLVPLGETLSSDPRCALVQQDFFQTATKESGGFYKEQTDKLAHAVLLDIDHSPRHWLNDQNGDFYTEQALSSMANKLYSGGIFGLWSNDPVDDKFVALLYTVFQSTESHIISFPNPYTGGKSENTVYIAHKN